MNRIVNIAVSAVITGLAAGCWTFGTSEYPASCITHSPANKDVSITVLGFDAMVTEYVSASGFQTVYIPDGPGPYHSFGWVQTVPTTTTWAQARPTDAYRRRAIDSLEKGGYILNAANPEWTVEATFEGPFRDGGVSAWRATWMICTIFFCDYTAETWKASLRVRDNRTGKLVFSNDYLQRYETKAFGAIPLFGIMACNETAPSYCQGWCLAALTDRVVAEASSVIGNMK